MIFQQTIDTFKTKKKNILNTKINLFKRRKKNGSLFDLGMK